MLRKDDYKDFVARLVPVIEDAYVTDPTEEEYAAGRYFARKGIWFEEYAYFYDIEKAVQHKEELLSLCEMLPKRYLPALEDSEVIMYYALLQEDFGDNPEVDGDALQQVVFAEHFANLLTAAGIANTELLTMGESPGFAIVPVKEYRSYFKENRNEFTETELQYFQ